ncbi:hypothetical protein AU099_gp72 [Gordonia phage GTE8]|uniref:Uncharacterized protein n=1 Tax=Gordonia phage GTE8 TaxID=1647475 RepID=A0A0K0N6H1_9CAUD|nr:hypothetical protein AU099_gp72 [Gordonia phage GTE8]AKJ72415.1 hypothetical protein GTE8_72 [Gordonia phage GTE8]
MGTYPTIREQRVIDHVNATRLGSVSDDGLLQLTDIGYDDDNGAVSVTVRELIGHNGWTCSKRSLDKRMRRFAARCSGYGERARVSVERRWIAYGCDNVTYTVTRPTTTTPGERSRARVDAMFLDAGWRSAASDKPGHPDVYARDTRNGGPRAMVQIYRDPARGRVTGATLFDDDGRAYPFPSHGTLRAVSAYLLGYRWEVTTYNGAVPTFGTRYGPSGTIVFPTERAAREHFKRVNREHAATVRRVPPAQRG